MDAETIISQSSFSMLKGKIDSRILKALDSIGIEKPTRIQAESLPYLLQHKDMIGAAKTGSGKTLAFLIPVIENLLKFGITRKHGTGCIILSPTRELALQTFDVLKKLLVDIDLTCCLIVGGEKKAKDVLKLQKGANIVVSTPGRLLDHLQNTEKFKCNYLKCFVVDEADKLLEAGFEKHINGIVNLLPKNRQTILFSATIDNKVENLARLTLRSDPVHVSVTDEKNSTVAGLQQGYYICPVEMRIPWLYKMLKRCKKLKVMVFFSSCKSVDFHYDFFKSHCQAKVLSIHGQLTQAQRKEAYHSFVESKSGILFCTDVAARGLDIPKVDWIVQYDPPTDPKEYIHRVGRTARGINNTGNAVILLRPEEEEFVSYLKTEKVFLDKYNFGDLPQEVQDMILTALNFYARGSYQGSVGQNMDGPMAQQTVSRCLKEVTNALNAPHVLRKFIRFPQNRHERNVIKQRFFERYEIPGVIGCIDCTHIAIVKPTHREDQYFNRKHFHSINTQVLEEIISNNGVMKVLARKAFLSFLRCYQKHPMKKVFNIKSLDLKCTAKAYGFKETPDVDFLNKKK